MAAFVKVHNQAVNGRPLKKLFLILLLLPLAPVSFALDFSMGAGASLDFTSIDIQGTLIATPVDSNESLNPLGLKVFIDAQYVQASVGYMTVHNGTLTLTVNGSSFTAGLTGILNYATFAVYLKYPFLLRSMHIFPLLGVEYKLNTAAIDGSGNDIKAGMSPQEQADLNELWIQAGVGMDLLSGTFFFRPEVLVGFKPASASDRASLLALQPFGYTDASIGYVTVNVEFLFGWVLSGDRPSRRR